MTPGIRRPVRTVEQAPAPPPGIVAPGGSIVGRVVDRTGRPVAGARVVLYGSNGERPAGKRIDSRLLDADGSFEIPTPAAGTFGLQARAQNVGASARVLVEVPPAQPAPPVTLTVEGDGVLAGRVVGPTGAPRVGYRLSAEPYPGPPARDAELARGPGMTDGSTTTDTDGRFRIEGLQLRHFTLHGGTGLEERNEALLTDEPVEAGRLDLELTVEAMHTIRLTAVEPGGATLAMTRRTGRDVRNGLPGPSFSVTACRDDGRPLSDPDRGVGYGSALTDGSHVVQVAADASYLVSVVDTTRGIVQEQVFVPWNVYHRDVVLWMPPASPPGTLKVRARLAEAPNSRFVGTRVLTEEGLVLCSSHGNQGDLAIRLPAGTYRVLASESGLRTCGNAPLPRLTHAGRESLAVVHANTTTTLELELGTGGTIEIGLALPPPYPPQPSGSRDVQAWEAVHDEHFALTTSARVRLHPAGGGSPVLLNFALRGGPVETVLPIAFPDTNTSYSPIAPGWYTLVAECGGRPDLHRPVLIEAGETTRVDLLMAPEQEQE